MSNPYSPSPGSAQSPAVTPAIPAFNPMFSPFGFGNQQNNDKMLIDGQRFTIYLNNAQIQSNSGAGSQFQDYPFQGVANGSDIIVNIIPNDSTLIINTHAKSTAIEIGDMTVVSATDGSVPIPSVTPDSSSSAGSTASSYEPIKIPLSDIASIRLGAISPSFQLPVVETVLEMYGTGSDDDEPNEPEMTPAQQAAAAKNKEKLEKQQKAEQEASGRRTLRQSLSLTNLFGRKKDKKGDKDTKDTTSTPASPSPYAQQTPTTTTTKAPPPPPPPPTPVPPSTTSTSTPPPPLTPPVPPTPPGPSATTPPSQQPHHATSLTPSQSHANLNGRESSAGPEAVRSQPTVLSYTRTVYQNADNRLCFSIVTIDGLWINLEAVNTTIMLAYIKAFRRLVPGISIRDFDAPMTSSNSNPSSPR